MKKMIMSLLMVGAIFMSSTVSVKAEDYAYDEDYDYWYDEDIEWFPVSECTDTYDDSEIEVTPVAPVECIEEDEDVEETSKFNKYWAIYFDEESKPYIGTTESGRTERVSATEEEVKAVFDYKFGEGAYDKYMAELNDPYHDIDEENEFTHKWC